MSEHCREEEYILYLDGRVSRAERRRLDEHLATCDACRAQLEELRAVMGVLGEWKAVEPTPGFEAALRARLAQEPASRQGWLVLRPAYLVALAVAVLLAVGIILWQSTPPPVAAPPQVVQSAPPKPVSPPRAVTRPPSPAAAEDELAVLDNPVLLENYELLEQFDVLFEPVPKEGKKL